jgi:hypothetical protein
MPGTLLGGDSEPDVILEEQQHQHQQRAGLALPPFVQETLSQLSLQDLDPASGGAGAAAPSGAGGQLASPAFQPQHRQSLLFDHNFLASSPQNTFVTPHRSSLQRGSLFSNHDQQQHSPSPPPLPSPHPASPDHKNTHLPQQQQWTSPSLFQDPRRPQQQQQQMHVPPPVHLSPTLPPVRTALVSSAALSSSPKPPPPRGGGSGPESARSPLMAHLAAQQRQREAQFRASRQQQQQRDSVYRGASSPLQVTHLAAKPTHSM